MAKLGSINVRGDLFATASTFAAQAVVRLLSSLVLTRVLRPEAYGILTILLSIAFVIEMLGDIAVSVSVIRHENGDQPAFLNTAWTMKLVRSVLAAIVLFFCAPLIARVYGVSALISPLRVFSLWFIFSGFESMSFPLATRRKNSRVQVISELQAAVAAAIFTVSYCYVFRDYWGLIYGTLLNRLAMTVLSYRYYPELRPRLQFHRKSSEEIFRYTRYSVPSSLLTLALSQFDKVVFPRLFGLQLLGIYGLASNISGSVESLVVKISQLVLYPRSAQDYRTDRASFPLRYYTSNVRLFVSILFMPAAVGGAAQLIISILYDPRYSRAGFILQAFMVRAALLALASPAEDMLIATGEYQVILIGNIFRALWIVCGSLLGYYLYGFPGFVYGTALSGLPPLLYYLNLQRRKGYLVPKYEVYRLAFLLGIAILSYVASSFVSMVAPGLRIPFRSH